MSIFNWQSFDYENIYIESNNRMTKSVKKCKKNSIKMAVRHTLTGTAQELGVTRQAIYYWIRKGWLMPKRDYRDYPVFTDQDLKRIRKWLGTLRKGTAHIKIKRNEKVSVTGQNADNPYTWKEIQKIMCDI